MGDLVSWLRSLNNDGNFKVQYRTLLKETYAREWEERTISITPTKPPEFFSKNVDLGKMAEDLKTFYVEVHIENAGYKQPHDFLLSGVQRIKDKTFLYFSSEFTNWPIHRIIVFDDYNNIIRNDFKSIYKLSWKDFSNQEYSAKAKP